MKLTKLILFFCIASLSITAYGQKFLDKPYQEWSADEAKKITEQKPFADQYQSVYGNVNTSIGQQVREQADTRLGGQDRGRGNTLSQPPPVIIRLHSAQPVRQALVRLRQIASGYDKMNADDKKKFDAANATLLTCPICKDYYVITMLKFKNSAMGVVDDGLFQTMKLEDFKGKVWLINDKGERRELEQFTAAKGTGETSVFYFKRLDENGKPFITPETKDFKFFFHNDLRQVNNAYSGLIPASFEFRVDKIMINGKVEF